MDNLPSWWAALSGMEKFFWAIAISFSVLFLLQFLMMMLGFDLDSDADMDMDHDTSGDIEVGEAGDTFHLFSIRSIIAFFTIFGWSGVVLLDMQWPLAAVFILSFIFGAGTMFLVSYLFSLIYKMEQSGTLNLHNAIFETGEVYIPIPGKKEGVGKVLINVQGSLRELEAITEGQNITTGTKVKVKEVLDNDTLLVIPEEG